MLLRPFLALLGALVLAAPTLAAAPTPAPRVFRVALAGPLPLLDPTRRPPILSLDLALWDTLVGYDPATGLARPGLAESWKVSDDGLTWTFFLKKARWSDGADLVAADVASAWSRSQGRSGGRYEALDGRTLRAQWSRPPASAAVFALGTWAVVSDDPERRTSGPFVLEARGPGNVLTLAKNPSYREASGVRFDRLTFTFWDTVDAADQRFRAGLADWVPHGWGPGVAPTRQGKKVVIAPAWGLIYVKVNPLRPALTDPEVTRILGSSLDRPALLAGLRGPLLWPATGLVPQAPAPGTPASAPKAPAPKAGKPVPVLPPLADLPRLTLVHPVGETPRRLAEALARQWAQGPDARVDPKQTSPAALEEERRIGNYDLALSAWVGDYPDPATFAEGVADPDTVVPLAWYASANLIDLSLWKGWTANPTDAHPWVGFGPKR